MAAAEPRQEGGEGSKKEKRCQEIKLHAEQISGGGGGGRAKIYGDDLGEKREGVRRPRDASSFCVGAAATDIISHSIYGGQGKRRRERGRESPYIKDVYIGCS